MANSGGFGRRGPLYLDIHGNDDLLDRLAHLDELRRARLRMRVELPTLGPRVRLVVVVDVAEQERRVVLWTISRMSLPDTHRPEVPILGFSSWWNFRLGWAGFDLQIEGRRLDGLLLLAGQPREAVGERVGDQELHQRRHGTPSSPRRRGG